MQNNFKAPFKSVLNEAMYFVKDRRADNPELFVKRKAIVSVLIPDSCFAKKPFRLKPEHIAYEDSDIVIADKPIGLSTQGTQVFGEDHLYGALIAHYTEKHPSRLAYVGLHHRLDRDTSGLVIFTKKPSMNKPIAEQFRDHEITKKYLALVEGPKPEKSWTVDAPIARIHSAGPKKQFKFGVDKKKGDPAETRFSYVKSLSDTQHLIECQPITGRTHQIRIHLAHSGLPIVGDPVYGVKTGGRMMLHAFQLSLTHPKTKKPLEVKSAQKLSL
jgi:RluA family pseudouridine synthase